MLHAKRFRKQSLPKRLAPNRFGAYQGVGSTTLLAGLNEQENAL